ncbi:glycosyltransferase [Streptomyces sp. NBC_01669]|uniref:glycosyltransferase n=1 Tax=Streptomyces sp. NBC_01669 TaxID=2975909 RepID=UPI00225346B8|nr:glycosyltransferase [Streptomyces sp. NBC_01669]MCX4538319.1 glycosyltransferase [Streptomyces sp. NBC_01669]
MNVVIVNAFERGNRGDAALLSVAIDQVRAAYPGARVRIAGFEEPEEHAEFDGAENLGSIRRYVGKEDTARIARITGKLLATLLGLLAVLPGSAPLIKALARLMPTEINREVRALAEADLVLSLGGGYLRGTKDFPSDLSVAFLLLPLWLAARFGTPVVLGPQSYGPFPTRLQRMLMRRVLRHARLISVREDISVRRLSEIGVPGRNTERGIDSAFAFRGQSHRPWREELGIPASSRLVLVTARQHLPEAQQTAYESAMAATISHLLVGADCDVVLVPQVTCAFQADDDRIVNRRIAAQVDSARLHLVDDASLSHHDVFALYGQADLILGTRFHSVIFGLLSEVPCAAIEYDHKTRGIMEDLGLGEWVLRMDEVRADNLIPMVDLLIEESAGYRAHLCSVLPQYRARAEEFTERLRSVVPAPQGARTPGERTVAVVSSYYPPKIGGVENYAARIAEAVAAAPGMRAVVLTTNTEGRRTRVSVENGVTVVRLGTWLKLSNSPISPLWPLQVRRRLRRERVDVVNAHAPVPGLADISVFAAKRRPTVLTYHAGTMHKQDAEGGLANRIIAVYERSVLPRLMARATVPVAVAPGSMAYGRPRAQEIPPGVDTERWIPGPPPSERPPVVVYVGRMDSTSRWKGVDQLIRAFALLTDLPEAQLKLIGGGDDVENLLKLAAELGVADRVIAAGELRGEELVDAVRHARAGVLSSVSDAECFGTALAEAQACGTPAVGTAVGGLPFTVADGETGLVVPPRDPEALAAALRTLLTDGELADRMGRAGRRRVVEKYDWQLLTERYNELFRSL